MSLWWSIFGYHNTSFLVNFRLSQLLRHTYAQHLLEAGISVFEIKEMLGHDDIEATNRYLHIHLKLMRRVILGELV
ncbi:MAG: tyrosine-type recombinase/integrase [Desulforhopalus sp.]|nr:tyrosine-type recombinase/integrase [Desulforhopalus sp.]